jgi:hypothetical protein
MPRKLLDSLMLGRCSHEFSWPRRDPEGDYYQVCLLCAAQYKYDWKLMQRIERLDQEEPANGQPPAAPARRSHVRKPTWVPRARRVKLRLPVRYRVKHLGTWYEGNIDNLSQSGVLFSGTQRFPDNTLIEMIFEMPEEISGQKNSNVLCQARVIRSKVAKDGTGTVDLAVSILDYKFLRRSHLVNI